MGVHLLNVTAIKDKSAIAAYRPLVKGDLRLSAEIDRQALTIHQPVARNNSTRGSLGQNVEKRGLTVRYHLV